MWYIYTMEYYSDIKRMKFFPFAPTWMDLEGIVLLEARQRQTLYDMTCMWNLKNITNVYNKMYIMYITNVYNKKAAHT